MEMMNSIIFSASKDITWQSKMVSRDQPEVDPSSDTHCTADFWDRLVQQPSSLWMEEYQEAPPLLMSGCAAQRPEGEEGGPWPWEAAPTPQRLPSPKELCQKKRKGPKQKGLRHLRGLSVLYHLEEVKRRQSNIDKQKAAQEGGALPQLSPQRNGMVRDLPACLLSPARTPEPYARPFLGRGTGAQLLLHPQWNPNLREPRRFSEESPLAFYAVAAHHRSLHAGSTELLRPEE
ncbi:protein INCA1 isoform X7 [Ahaetulla prasina]|uniref:protein INCA1 isoform X7 n=1 Tax=Ahaetulla prasina TaxID=499056 RepID=UPI0026473BB5|nr:protein INCA1 isoform X7 [Ahaetulla prasina]